MIRKNQILMFSCFDPVGNQGGVSKVVREHMKILTEAGYSCALLFPIAKVRTKYWGYILDGKFQSLISNKELCNMISKYSCLVPCILKKNYKQYQSKICEIHIHHIMRMDIDAVQDILQTNLAHIKLFIHDFYTICPSINLIDSTGKYCGSAPVSKLKCADCEYYTKAAMLQGRMRSFLTAHKRRLNIIAPSKFALDTWMRSYGDIIQKAHVLPLQILQGHYKGNRTIKSPDDPLKIAYIGICMPNKGYPQWKKAVERCIRENRNYQFYIFGHTTERIQSSSITEVKVNVRKNPMDMVEKLRKNQIDVAVLNSIWGETYSFTFFESFASNAFILTSNVSGNIAQSVKIFKNGWIMNSPEELEDIISNEKELRKRVNIWKRTASGPLELLPNESIINLIDTDANDSTFVNTNVNTNYFTCVKDNPLLEILEIVKKCFLTIAYRIARIIRYLAT